MILQIFRAYASESEPPKTVKSCANTNTGRPWMRPEPVTTPSPGIRCSAMPKSCALVHDELVELGERAGVEEELEPLARRLLARLVLAANALLAAAQLGLGVAAAQLFEALLAGTSSASLEVSYRNRLHRKSMYSLTFWRFLDNRRPARLALASRCRLRRRHRSPSSGAPQRASRGPARRSGPRDRRAGARPARRPRRAALTEDAAGAHAARPPASWSASGVVAERVHDVADGVGRVVDGAGGPHARGPARRCRGGLRQGHRRVRAAVAAGKEITMANDRASGAGGYSRLVPVRRGARGGLAALLLTPRTGEENASCWPSGAASVARRAQELADRSAGPRRRVARQEPRALRGADAAPDGRLRGRAGRDARGDAQGSATLG